ncbi:MAG: ABC transporter permease [Bacteroidetes bacterium]|nr:ABC transporter permease [Bacteroidota bacterium]
MAALTIGMTSFILIFLYILDEKSYDRQNVNARNIYRIVSVYDFQGVGERSSSCPFPLGPTLKMEYPDLIKNMVRFYNNWSTPYFVQYGEKSFNENRLFFVDSTVFDVFTIPFIRGNPKTSLAEPGTVVITQSTAKRYFGDEDPLGKSLRIQEYFSVTVTGIIEDPSSQSHFTYDFLVSMSTIREINKGAEPKTWVWNPYWTYVLLNDNVKPEILDAKFDGFIKKYFYDAEKEHITLYLQPLLDIHLKSDLDYEIEQNGNITYIRILTIIAVFILVIACINFINLSTAMAGRRAMEIGMKKVFGSYPKQMIVQFISETVVICVISLLISLALVEIILPFFNFFTDKNITSNYFYDIRKIIILVTLAIITGLVSGLYPAFYLSQFAPVRILRGDLTRGFEGILARKILVVIQFVISIGLIIGTLIAYQQIRYISNADLGFRNRNIIYIPVGLNPIVRHYDAVKGELLKSPDILYVTASDYIIGTQYNRHEFRPEGYPEDQWQYYPTLVIRGDFVKTFDIQIVAGRDYDKNSLTDPEKSILINESMVKYLGWKSNSDAIGKRFKSFNGDEKVIGVFKDFHAGSLHYPISPLVLNLKEDDWEINYYTRYLVVRYAPGKLREVLPYIKGVWDEFEPDRPFEYKVLDNELKKLYKEEYVLAKLSLILTILVILIAMMGLFGLASFEVFQRTKELGMRRVLGANLIDISVLLMRKFHKLILISILIAWPLTYLMLRYWLNHFAYHTSLNVWGFILSGLISFLITLVVILFKAISATYKIPVKQLRSE